jgi:hypothetical protein
MVVVIVSSKFCLTLFLSHRSRVIPSRSAAS